MLKQKSKLTVLTATMAITCAAQTLSAQETINTTVLSGYTDRTAWVHHLKEFFMPEVNKRLAETGNYTLNYNEAFGTVVKPRG